MPSKQSCRRVLSCCEGASLDPSIDRITPRHVATTSAASRCKEGVVARLGFAWSLAVCMLDGTLLQSPGSKDLSSASGAVSLHHGPCPCPCGPDRSAKSFRRPCLIDKSRQPFCLLFCNVMNACSRSTCIYACLRSLCPTLTLIVNPNSKPIMPCYCS